MSPEQLAALFKLIGSIENSCNTAVKNNTALVAEIRLLSDTVKDNTYAIKELTSKVDDITIEINDYLKPGVDDYYKSKTKIKAVVSTLVMLTSILAYLLSELGSKIL